MTTIRVMLKTIDDHQYQVTKQPEQQDQYYFTQGSTNYFIRDTERFKESGLPDRLDKTYVPSDWDQFNLEFDHTSTLQGNRFVKVFLEDDLEHTPLISE